MAAVQIPNDPIDGSSSSQSSLSTAGRKKSVSIKSPPRSPKPERKLSAAAIYANKLKYGIYDNPSAPTVGVPLRSSDTAAVLAASSDLSLKLWQHDTYAEAGTAAVLANSTNTSPNIWKPDASPSAASAALSAKDRTVIPKEGREHITGSGRSASLAAISASSVSGRDTAALALPEAYAWTERTSEAMGRRASVQVYQPNAVPARNDSISARSRSGSNASASEQLYNNIGAIEEKARRNTETRLSKLYLSSSSNSNLKINSTGSGAAALAIASSREEEAQRFLKEQQSFLEAANQHESILAAAKQRAAVSLAEIDKKVGEKNLFLNESFNSAALAIAEKNGRARLETHGKIHIGGGVYMTQSEIEAIAERNVRPVLNEITEKAAAQRQADEEKRAADEEEKQKRLEEKKAEQEKKAEEKQVILAQRAEEKRVETERKTEERRVKAEEAAQAKAVSDKLKAEDKERKAAEKAQRDEQKAAEKARKDEEKAKAKAEKNALLEDRRKTKHALKTSLAAVTAAAALATHAEAIAKSELTKTDALKTAALAKIEQAKLAESQAASEAQAEAARAETAKAEAELAKAEAERVAAEARIAEAEAAKAKADADVAAAVQAEKELSLKPLEPTPVVSSTYDESSLKNVNEEVAETAETEAVQPTDIAENGNGEIQAKEVADLHSDETVEPEAATELAEATEEPTVEPTSKTTEPAEATEPTEPAEPLEPVTEAVEPAEPSVATEQVEIAEPVETSEESDVPKVVETAEPTVEEAATEQPVESDTVETPVDASIKKVETPINSADDTVSPTADTVVASATEPAESKSEEVRSPGRRKSKISGWVKTTIQKAKEGPRRLSLSKVIKSESPSKSPTKGQATKLESKSDVVDESLAAVAAKAAVNASKPSDEITAVNSSAAVEKKAEEPAENAEITRTFSGFSQGSGNDEDKDKIIEIPTEPVNQSVFTEQL